MAKCGVAGPISSSTSSKVGSTRAPRSEGSVIGATLPGYVQELRVEHLAFAPVRHRLPPDVLLLVTVLFWSFNFTVVKYALTHGWEPLAYSSIRFAAAAVIFSAFTYGREHTLRVARADVRLLLVAAALGIWLNPLAFTYSVKLTTAATVALMFGTLPVFVALIAVAFRLERPHARHWVATVVSFLGVGLVAAGASSGISGDLGGILLGLG